MSVYHVESGSSFEVRQEGLVIVEISIAGILLVSLNTQKFSYVHKQQCAFTMSTVVAALWPGKKASS
jgi:hypothetical protein